MSGLVCPHCDKEIPIFGKGDGEKMAEDMGAIYLGPIPMEMETREAGDKGMPIVLSNPESKTASAFTTTGQNVMTLLEK